MVNNPSLRFLPAFCVLTTMTSVALAHAQTLFNDATSSAAGMPRHHIILVADLDSNGVDDLVVNAYNNVTDSWETQLWKRQTGLSYTNSSAGSNLLGLEPVSAGDFNNDGSIDFVHVNGARTQAAFYRNAGNGSFAKVAIPAAEAAQLFGFQDSVRTVDIDSDGDLDLVFGKALGSGGSIVAVLNQSRNGASADQPFSGATTLAVTGWIHNKAEVTDANGDGKPDLLSLRTAGDWPNGTHPDYPVTLFLNTGSSPADFLNPNATQSLAGFTRRDDCGISAANVMSPLATLDIDNDGDLDLINGSSDWPWTSRPHIYINDGGGNYTQMNSPVYQSSNYYHHGISLFDADLDNDLDAVWTSLHNFANTYPRMWRNNGNLTFDDVTSGWGITARIPGSGNHGMGGYHADLDGDGDLDFVVDISNGWGSEKVFSIYRNDSVQNGANWLGIKLVSGASAPGGIGARVEVTADGKKLTQYMADVTGGVRNLSDLRFGLGSSTSATSVKVYWPSGRVTQLTDVAGNRIVNVSESSDTDNDGVTDYRETADGTDPNDPASFDPLSKGLVAYYPFDGSANDESGYGNDGMVTGAVPSGDRFGRTSSAFYFDGSSFITGGNVIPNYKDGATLSCWVKSSHIGLLQGAVCKPRPYGDYGGFGVGVGASPGAAYAGVNTDPYYGALQGGVIANTAINSPASIANGQWHHLLATVDGNAMRFYLNGLFVGEEVFVSDPVTSNRLLQIGREGEGGPQYGPKWFFGSVDEVRVYNRALSEAEARQLYAVEAAGLDSDGDGVTDYRERKDGTDPFDAASFNPLSKGLVAYYPFEGNANDESGFGDHLTLTAASLAQDRFQVARAALLADSPNGIAAEGTKVMSIQGNVQRTISFWARMDVSSSESSLGAGWGNASSPGNASLLSAYGTGEVNFWGHHADLNKAQEPNFVGFWRHLTFVYPGSLAVAKVYVDGREKPLALGNQNLRGDLDTLQTTMKIAGWGFTETQAGASIDEIRVYNRALSGAEVAQLYAVEAADLDSDNDGLDDVHETNTGTFVSATDAGTDPFDPDTSGDGILDGEAVLWNFNPLTDHTQVLAFLRHATGVQSGRFGLYTEANIMDLNIGGVMLQKSGNQASVRFKVESKMDLRNASWTDRGTYLLPPIEMPGSKGFLRIRAEQH